jgi:hypothetical protein
MKIERTIYHKNFSTGVVYEPEYSLVTNKELFIKICIYFFDSRIPATVVYASGKDDIYRIVLTVDGYSKDIYCEESRLPKDYEIFLVGPEEIELTKSLRKLNIS